MSLGVLNNISAMYAENNLNQTQASLQNTLTQLSSGSRINSGSDDAAGLAVVNDLQANEAALTQSASNASTGVGMLQTADGALSQVTSLLNRAVTLATEASNSTLNTSQVSSANQEYQNILSEIGNIGSTTNFNGQAAFTNGASTIFVSDGTSTGSTSFNDIVGGLTVGSVGQTAATAATTSTASATNATGAAASSTTLASDTLTVAAGPDSLSGQMNITIGSGASATVVTENIAAGSTLQNVHDQLAGDSRLANQGLTFTMTSATVLTVKETTVGQNTLTLTAGTTPLADATTAFAVGTGLAAATAGVGTAAKSASSTIQLAGLNDTLSGSLAVTVGGTATTINVAAGTTGQALASQISSNSTMVAAGVSAAYNKTSGLLTITGPAGSTTLTTSASNLSDTTGATAGAGVDFSQSAVSTLTSNSAQNVLNAVTTAIADVAYQRGILGADVNQLNAASNVANAETENLTSASSSIQSTNYGQATSDMAKFQVLSQTGIAALSQANSVQQEILKLLQ
jgi:flagellin